MWLTYHLAKRKAVQFKVPQHIDEEDKILGPLTFVQFIYVLIGGSLLLLAFSFFDFALFLLVGIPIIVLTAAFALIKVQDQPFSRFFTSAIRYLFEPKKRVWHESLAETPEVKTQNAKVKTTTENLKTVQPVTIQNPNSYQLKATSSQRPAKTIKVKNG